MRAPSRDQTVKEIALGLDAEKFIATDLGRYMLQRAEGNVEEAVEALKAVNPENAKEVRDLQNIIMVNEYFLYWLADAVTQGKAAEEILNQQE
jgi:hypothetical protein